MNIDLRPVESVTRPRPNNPSKNYTDHTQQLVVDGVVYERRGTEYEGEPTPDYADINKRHFDCGWSKDRPDCPTVRCGRCYGSAFTLSIGGYAVDAKCVACGFEDEVYSG